MPEEALLERQTLESRENRVEAREKPSHAPSRDLDYGCVDWFEYADAAPAELKITRFAARRIE